MESILIEVKPEKFMVRFTKCPFCAELTLEDAQSCDMCCGHGEVAVINVQPLLEMVGMIAKAYGNNPALFNDNVYFK